jgi:exosortase A-associated hydrolase 1
MLSAAAQERPCVFACNGEELLGIVHQAPGQPSRGLVFVVGGPQYRIGSHRQFVHLARAFAASGYPCMRFDARGMGDSSGVSPGFEAMAEDIRAAIDAFLTAAPGLTEVILWGLCDGASAAALYAPEDARVAGLVLVNPWVRTDALEARARLSGYYAARIRERDFWQSLFRGRIGRSAVAGAIGTAVRVLGGRSSSTSAGAGLLSTTLPQRLAAALARFRGRMLFILSGNDLTAREFEHLCTTDERWSRLMARAGVVRFDLPAANHTFSRSEWRASVESATIDWLGAIPESANEA